MRLCTPLGIWGGSTQASGRVPGCRSLRSTVLQQVGRLADNRVMNTRRLFDRIVRCLGSGDIFDTCCSAHIINYRSHVLFRRGENICIFCRFVIVVSCLFSRTSTKNVKIEHRGAAALDIRQTARPRLLWVYASACLCGRFVRVVLWALRDQGFCV